MTAVRKFLFDTSFDPSRPAPAEKPGARPEAEPEPVVPTFSEDELEAARQAALAEGREAGAADAMASLEQRIAQSLETVLQQVETLLADQAAAAETRRAVAMRLSVKAIETLFPSLAQSTRLAEVSSTIEAVLRQLEDEPRVVIRVADDTIDPLRERLSGLTQSARFDGQVVLLPDETLGPGALRVEWASGGAERDPAQLWQDLRAAVEAHLANLPETATTDLATAGTAPAPK